MKKQMYGSEALAYYLQLAIEGERKNDFGEFALVLKDEDLDFFVGIGLISQRMKENIKYLLLDKKQRMQDKSNILKNLSIHRLNL